MKNLYLVSVILAGLFFLSSCSTETEDLATPIVTTEEEIPLPEIVEFDSFTLDYSVCLFSRDSISIQIQSADSVGHYTLVSKSGAITSVSKSDTILCKRGDQISFDANADGKPEQTETVTFPWFTVDPTFYPSQYGDSAYTHIEVYTFITHIANPENPNSYVSHYQWGNYYIIRNGVRYSLSTFGVTGNWCNGTCNPYIKIWTKDGDIIVLDYNNDGKPEFQYTVTDPNHV